MIIGIDASRANVEQRTGTERYAWEVTRRLVRQAPEHEFRLYVREPLRADWPPLPSNVRVCVLRWPPKILWSHIRLSIELLMHAPDVLFVPADTVPLIHPRNTVTTIHDVAFERFPELYRQKSIQRRLGLARPVLGFLVRLMTFGRYGLSERDYHRWSVRQAVRTCPRILTVSEFSKHEIVDTIGADPQKITVTPLGIRQTDERREYSTADVMTMRQQYGLTRPYIVFIGRLEKKKNIALLMTSYALYRQQVDNPVDLVLAGTPGYGWDEAAEIFAAKNLTGVVHQLGWVSDNDIDLILGQARAFIYISQYEGFGIPALDAMAAGVPVVASRLGSLPEVLGEAPWYTATTPEKVAKAIKSVTTDDNLRQILISLGRERVRHYTWDRTAEETANILWRTGLSK